MKDLVEDNLIGTPDYLVSAKTVCVSVCVCVSDTLCVCVPTHTHTHTVCVCDVCVFVCVCWCSIANFIAYLKGDSTPRRPWRPARGC